MNMLIVTKKSYLEVKMTENWPIWNHDLPASCDMVGDVRVAINETMHLSVRQECYASNLSGVLYKLIPGIQILEYF